MPGCCGEKRHILSGGLQVSTEEAFAYDVLGLDTDHSTGRMSQSKREPRSRWKKTCAVESPRQLSGFGMP